MDELEKKARKKESRRKYREKNKEKIKEYNKEYNRKYYESETGKKYHQKYRESESRKKSYTIYNWKRNGLIGDYDAIYHRYINSTHCELCKQQYTDTNMRCMDHCHISGKFRNICCNSCNMTLPYQTTDITYDKYIYPYGNGWRFSKKFKGKTYCKKRSKSRIDLLCYKYIVFLQIRVQWRKIQNA